MESLVKVCDVVTINCPLHPETENLFDESTKTKDNIKYKIGLIMRTIIINLSKFNYLLQHFLCLML